MKRPALVAFLTVLIFYLLTLAPTVLWGDDAEFQRRAYTLDLGAGVRGHPLYIVWAHAFTKLPVGDIALRVNLCSAVSAAAGVALVYALLRRRMGGGAALAGAGALALSQAYWMHAVRAEVYSTYLVLFALSLYAGVRWLDERRPAWLGLCAFVLAVACSVHLLALTALPALVFLLIWSVWQGRSWSSLACGLGGFALGLLPLAFFLSLAGSTELLGQLTATLQASLSPQPARWGKDALLGAGYLLYQFPLTLPLAVSGVWSLWRSERPLCIYLALAGLGSALFAFDFQVPDRYVFYLPAYLIVALFIGEGAAPILKRRPARGRLLAAAVAAPLALYLLLPLGLNALDLNPLGLRDLPYRNGNLFHLLPAKTAYWGPRTFGETVLRSLPAGALLLADATIRQNLLYLQSVERLRPDVEVVEIYAGQGRQAPFIAAEISRRRVFVGALDRYLDWQEIEAQYRIEPFGLVYEVMSQ